VQVFGCRYAETIDARWGPASEKRQGRKSRSVVQRRRGVRDEFHLAAIVQNLKTLALRTLKPPPAQPRVSFV
jgi:hypothetical protein